MPASAALAMRSVVAVGLGLCISWPAAHADDTCGVVAENAGLQLTCPDGGSIKTSSIITFGTPMGDCDDHNIQPGDCDAPDLAQQFQDCCVSRNTCEMSCGPVQRAGSASGRAPANGCGRPLRSDCFGFFLYEPRRHTHPTPPKPQADGHSGHE